MKILQKKYPMNSFAYQQTAGRYIDETLYENLKILAKNIVKDITYLGVCSSSTLEVGSGKSTLMTQIGEAYTDLVNQYHGLNLKFDMNNVVFKPKDLIDKAFKLPKYSFILLDEWEDAHYWSELGVTLRQFFRKCRQLNLFIIIIIPNFFQLGINYAVSRSLFFIDVKFEGEFDRGYFKFYNYDTKKNLYIHGKRDQNYNVTGPQFSGRFTNGYGVDEDEYRKAKYKDMIESEENVKVQTEEKERKQLSIICTILKKEFNLSSRKQQELLDKYNLHIDRHKICELIKENPENSDFGDGHIL
jgi:hypothetical protein